MTDCAETCADEPCEECDEITVPPPCARCGENGGNNWFDRSLCPCDYAMHTRCAECGYAYGDCPFEEPFLDVGPPAPGEFDPADYPNPEIGMAC